MGCFQLVEVLEEMTQGKTGRRKSIRSAVTQAKEVATVRFTTMAREEDSEALDFVILILEIKQG